MTKRCSGEVSWRQQARSVNSATGCDGLHTAVEPKSRPVHCEILGSTEPARRRTRKQGVFVYQTTSVQTTNRLCKTSKTMTAPGRIILLAASLLMFIPAHTLSGAAVTGEAHTVELDGAKLHYTNYGTGPAALVFIHGWSCDETVWSEQAPALGEKVRAITIDLPGHGQSDKPQIAYTMELYTRAIDAVLRDANVASVILVGHSNGTPVIREFYRQFPAKIRGLVIVEGGLRPFVDAANMEKFIAPLRGNNYQEAASKFINAITASIRDEKLRDRIRSLMLRTPQYVAVSEFEATANPALWKPDKIEVPVLMILAKQPVWTAEYEQFARSIVPNLDYQVWENVSHFVMMEKSREFNETVLSFLKENGLLPENS
jgi:pimeloyl-ACP methyl ester carboxylesterase